MKAKSFAVLEIQRNVLQRMPFVSCVLSAFLPSWDLRLKMLRDRLITEIAPNLIHVSKERVQVELTKLLLSDRPEAMKLVYETGISPYVSETFHKMGEMIGDMPVTVPSKKGPSLGFVFKKRNTGAGSAHFTGSETG